jgi:DNA-binding IclR family transcriptional regulator
MTHRATKSALPALDRGLYILNQLIRNQGPLRYNELRTQLSGIQDSTLSRTLKALENYGYVSRDADMGYSITNQVREWSPYLSQKAPDLTRLAIKEVDQLAERGQESAAAVLFTNDCLRTLCSRTIKDGIQVLDKGDLLHFEPDHAAAIAVLASMPAQQRKDCLQGNFSLFPKNYDFEKILHSMTQNNRIVVDRSQSRPGVCRMARYFQHDEQIGAIFYCLTIEACRKKQQTLSIQLIEATRRLNTSQQMTKLND